MLNIKVKLNRPFDRVPSDHFYGEPFDTAVDEAIGGRKNWSALRESHDQPKASISGQDITIELHEDGPDLHFVLQFLDQIPDYLSAIASVVSAWAATRELRKKALPANDFQSRGGTVIQMGDLRIESERNLSPEELEKLLFAIAATRLNSKRK